MALQLIQELIQPEANSCFGRLRAEFEVHVIACANPDGYARTWSQSGIGTLSELRTNARGVDLNRNFPLPPGARTFALIPAAGSRRPGDATFRGEAPGSEAEVRALLDLFERERYLASANLHSFMGTFIPARVTNRNDYASYKQLFRVFRDAQPHRKYRRLAHRIFDVFTGEQEDVQHHCFSCWSACIETFPVLASLAQHLRAPSLFWRFNPRNPEPWVANDTPAVASFLYAAASMRRPHSVSDFGFGDG